MSVDTESSLAIATDYGLRARVEDLYARYAETICDDVLEQWPDFFTEECIYKVIPRVNYERSLPVCLILAESRGGIVDRLMAIRKTMVYAPRYVSHTVSGVRVVSGHGHEVVSRSALVAHETICEDLTKLLVVGRTFDRLIEDDGILRFAERTVVLDTEALPSTLIYPL